MSGDGWGTSFSPVQQQSEPDSATAINAIWQNAQAIAKAKADVEPNEVQRSRLTVIEKPSNKVWFTATIKEHTNKVPTHDPYTNPDAELYYACGCGAILDPGTKSFAELNNQASRKGWKIRFSDAGYTPYCVDCGKGVD
jgi:hypothetical protein